MHQGPKTEEKCSNNKHENANHQPHQCGVGDRICIKLMPNRKHSSDQCDGPHTIHQINDNGTVKLTKVTNNGGAIYKVQNFRKLFPL